MKTHELLALLMLQDERIENLSALVAVRPKRGLPGVDGKDGTNGTNGKDFNLDEHKESLIALIKDTAPKFASLTDEEREQIRGHRGLPGLPGKSFSIEEYAEEIKAWIEERRPTFKDLTDEQKEELRGFRGKDGLDGKDFNMEEHAPTIKEWIYENRLQFKDLTPEEKESVRGLRGVPGAPGKDFLMEEHAETIQGWIDARRPTFKDLSDEDKEKLRGHRGKPGLNGKDFSFEESKEAITDAIRNVFGENIDACKLKFSDLTEEEVGSIKLKFSDLNEEEKASLRGLRGKPGQRGKAGLNGLPGLDGKDGKDGEKGKDGLNGTNGKDGINGVNGKPGNPGRDGIDGQDAPAIVDIILEETKDSFYFIFIFDNGMEISTNRIDRPLNKIVETYVIGGGMGNGSSGGGSLTISTSTNSYPNIKEIEFTDDLVVVKDPVTDKVTVSVSDDITSKVEVYHDGVLVGEASKVNFTGDVSVTQEPDGTITVDVAPNAQDPFLLRDYDCAPDVIIGDAVRLARDAEIPYVVGEWPELAFLLSLMPLHYGTLIVKACADTWDNSNVLGIVESKSSATKCDIRIGGPTGPFYVTMDVAEELYLSDTEPGKLVAGGAAPTAPGTVRVKIGQPLSPTTLLYSRGERMLRT